MNPLVYGAIGLLGIVALSKKAHGASRAPGGAPAQAPGGSGGGGGAASPFLSSTPSASTPAAATQQGGASPFSAPTATPADNGDGSGGTILGPGGGSQDLGPADVDTGTDANSDAFSNNDSSDLGNAEGVSGVVGATRRHHRTGAMAIPTCQLPNGELGVWSPNHHGWVPYYLGADQGYPPPPGLPVF